MKKEFGNQDQIDNPSDGNSVKPPGIRTPLISRNDLVTLIYNNSKINGKTGQATGFTKVHKALMGKIGKNHDETHKYLRAKLKKLQEQNVVVPVFSDVTKLPRKTKSLEETRDHAAKLAGSNFAAILKAIQAEKAKNG